MLKLLELLRRYGILPPLDASTGQTLVWLVVGAVVFVPLLLCCLSVPLVVLSMLSR